MHGIKRAPFGRPAIATSFVQPTNETTIKCWDPMSLRKKPHCRICGAPMAGHKRSSGVPICNSPVSPPTSPPRSSHQTSSVLTSLPPSPPASARRGSTAPRQSTRNASADFEEIVIPKYGLWRRPNPHWPDPPRPPPSPSYAGSLVPTVLDDDGDVKTQQESDGEDSADDRTIDSFASRSSGSLIEHALGHSVPLASLFRTPKADIPRVREAADKVGLHFGSLKADLRRENWWVVMGKSAEAVKHLLELEQKRMPGVLMTGEISEDVLADVKPQNAFVGFLQLVLAGAVGGLVVMYGLSRL